jgi:hypothetical protein
LPTETHPPKKFGQADGGQKKVLAFPKKKTVDCCAVEASEEIPTLDFFSLPFS